MRRAAAAVAIILGATWPASAIAAPAGVPDPSYGNHGVALLAYPGEAAQASALVQLGTQLVVVGNSATTVGHDGRSSSAASTRPVRRSAATDP